MLVFITDIPASASYSKRTTGTGNIVLSASPAFTGTITGVNQTLSGSLAVGTTLVVTGVATFTAIPIFSSATISTAAAFNASKQLVSVTNTGTGNNVLSASPTFTGTIIAASLSATGQIATTFTGIGGILVSAANPSHALNETGAAANTRYWDIAASGGQLFFRAINDALSASDTFMSVQRTAAVVDTVTFPKQVILSFRPRFNSTNTVGAGSALLGANCPAVTLTAPYTWIGLLSADGSSVYLPVWK